MKIPKISPLIQSIIKQNMSLQIKYLRMQLILRIAQKRNKHIDEATSNIRIKDTSKISSSEINTKKLY